MKHDASIGPIKLSIREHVRGYFWGPKRRDVLPTNRNFGPHVLNKQHAGFSWIAGGM